MPKDLIQKYLNISNRKATIDGLFIAQLICQRRFLDAFDVNNTNQKTATEVVSLIMEDISMAMEDINKHE